MTQGRSPFDINGAFRATTTTMLARLAGERKITTHPTTLGTGAELQWQETLKQFLPRRYDINPAFVVDTRGDTSEQIDLVIHDRHFSPTFWTVGNSLFLPAECVYAVLEVETKLTKANIEYAGKKAASVRSLYRTSGPITQLAQGPSRAQPKRILAGIVAARSGWSGGLGQPLVDALNGVEPGHELDLGCALDSGMFERPEGMTAADLQRSDSDIGLAMFAMRLVARLNATGTVPALDYDVYTSALTERVAD